MRISKRKINTSLEKELSQTFFQLIADLKTVQESQLVLTALLKENELTTVIKRVAVAYWLSRGRNVSNIKDNLAVAPATIETIKHQLSTSKGFGLALKKITADQWATRWTERIKKIMG